MADNILLGIIGGSGLYNMSGLANVEERHIVTPFGAPSDPLVVGTLNGQRIVFLARHGKGHRLTPTEVNYRANIYALKDLGVEQVVSWSETRAITHNFKIGQYVIISDLIDETRSRPTTFFEAQGLGDVRQWPVFCPSLSGALQQTLKSGRFVFDPGGVYCCIEGPRRETPAEAAKYAAFGADLLGNTLAPEVFLAKELQLCYACVGFVSSYAETGSDFRPFEHGRILDEPTQQRRARLAIQNFPRVLAGLFAGLQEHAGQCQCHQSMQPHVDSGRISADWRSWFENGCVFRIRPDIDASPLRLGRHVQASV